MDGRMHLWVDDKDHSAFKEYYDYEQNFTDIDHSDYDTVFISSSKPLYNRLNQLVYEGRWKKVYEDASSGIFVREKTLKPKLVLVSNVGSSYFRNIFSIAYK